MKHTVSTHKLSNGARGITVDVPGSSVINLEVHFNSGYSFGDRKIFELPHVLEHVLANVTLKYPGPNEFMIEAAKNGAYVNAFTNTRTNGYVYEFAPFELDRILDLLEEQLVRPLLAPEKLKSELGNVREELTRNTTQPGSVCSLALLAETQPTQWMEYSDRLAQLDRISADDMQRHFHRTHTAANAFFSVAGDIGSAEPILARLERLFDQLQEGSALTWVAERGKAIASPIIRHQPIGQVYYRMARSLPEVDLPKRRAMALLRTVLVGGMGSRILGKAREHGWAYTVGGIFSAEPGASGVGFGGYVTPEHTKPLFKLIDEQMKWVADGKLTKKELAASVQLLTGNWLRAMQTAADVLSWYSEEYDEWGTVRDFDAELVALREVSTADVQAMAQMSLVEGQFAMSLVGDVSKTQADEYQQALGAFAK